MPLRKAFIHNFLKNKGFSIIEMLVVIGILLLLIQIGLFISLDFYGTYSYSSVRNELVTILNKARSRAMVNLNQSNHGIKILDNPASLVIFQGYSYASRTAELDEFFSLSISPEISGMSEVVFNQITGNATVTGGNLNYTAGPKTGVISINSEGLIIW